MSVTLSEILAMPMVLTTNARTLEYKYFVAHIADPSKVGKETPTTVYIVGTEQNPEARRGYNILTRAGSHEFTHLNIPGSRLVLYCPTVDERLLLGMRNLIRMNRNANRI